jgi:hypothetical protein
MSAVSSLSNLGATRCAAARPDYRAARRFVHRAVLGKFVDKVVELLSQDIHLLILDLMAPTRRDPNGIHGAIWQRSPTRSTKPQRRSP